MRTFVAIELDKHAKDVIFNMQSKIKDNLFGVKWVEYENLHITLKFLGDVNGQRIEDVKEAILKVSSQFDYFKIKGGSIGAFPTPERARVIFFNIEDGKDVLYRIFENLEHKLSILGFERDKRSYHPHITIGRVKRGVQDIKKFLYLKADFTTNATGLTLFKSTLTPNGPKYTKIITGAFKWKKTL